MAKIKKVSTKPKMRSGGPVEKDYKAKIKAGQKEGWVIDQKGAYKVGLTDTASTTYLRKDQEFAGVKKPVKKKMGGSIKSKKK